MSIIGPMYDIPATVRSGIDYIKRFGGKETLQLCFEDIRESFNKHASESSIEQLTENLGYLDALSGYLNMLLNVLIDFGIDITKYEKEKEKKKEKDEVDEINEEQVPEKEHTPKQIFLNHVFKDYEKALEYQAYLLSSTLKVVAIGKEELSKYLPDSPDLSGSEKALSQTINK